MGRKVTVGVTDDSIGGVRLDVRSAEALTVVKQTMGMSKSEAVRAGLRLLAEYCRADEEGCVVQYRKPDGSTETVRFI